MYLGVLIARSNDISYSGFGYTFMLFLIFLARVFIGNNYA